MSFRHVIVSTFTPAFANLRQPSNRATGDTRPDTLEIEVL